MEHEGPQSHRNAPSGRDLPSRMGALWDQARGRLGTSRAMAAIAAAAALVLVVAVIWAAMSPGGGGGPEPAAVSSPFTDPSTSIATSPSTAVTPSPSPSPSPTPSPYPVYEDPPADEKTSPTPEAAAAEAEPGFPEDGRYTVRQEASGLCMDWGEEPGNDEGRNVFVLGDCDDPYPELSWDEQDPGVFQVEMDMDDTTPCMTVDYGGDETGLLVGFDGCEYKDTQLWRLDPVGGAFLIHTAASDMCLSVLKTSEAEAGDAVAIQDCDADDPKQQWTLG